ncbi:imidazolonepropionase [Bacteroides luti]|uniref:Imidazolonepropionase n=1 Tax=Bacteroides luti TaxID=1297750 RepID=A0A1M4UN68_9BACE|nr:imidazolonepropionase [Bacteroides luti]SHE58023.1 imidazolonepropionase [Bacteroides luti]
MKLLIINIRELYQVEDTPCSMVCGKDMAFLPSIKDAYLLMEDERISAFGEMLSLSSSLIADKVIDATGKFVLPAFCDSHTHIVYAGSREQEFIDKINGLSYEEIARRGGGILNSAKQLHEATEDQLYAEALVRVNEMIRIGTGAAEIKSGYGLNTEDELKMLRVIKRLRETTPLTIRATFLGAHAVPTAYKGSQSAYVDLIVNEMIPAVASEGLADFVDSFCDKGFFTCEETERIMEAGARYGMRSKIHANELALSGGIQIGVKHNALSVDHLEFTGDAEIEVLKDSSTMPTLLPGAAFFLGMNYAPARKMIDSGLPIALASDYNPGSSPSGNMKFILSLATIKMKLTPEEAINAATINSAYAMGLNDTHGSICIGKRANVLITKEIPSIYYLPYAYTSDLIDSVILGGKVVCF